MSETKATRHGWFGFEGFGRPFEAWSSLYGRWQSHGRCFTKRGTERRARLALAGRLILTEFPDSQDTVQTTETSVRPDDAGSQEAYPPGWLHATIHLHPATGEMHSDGNHEVRFWLLDRLNTQQAKHHRRRGEKIIPLSPTETSREGE